MTIFNIDANSYPRIIPGEEYHGRIHPDHARSPYPEKALKETTDKSGERKPRWELLPLDAIHQVARVLTAGAEKYEANSWQGVDSEHYVGALLRHLAAWRSGEEYDKDLDERGYRVSHLACVACNTLFLLWQELNKKGK